MDMADLVLMFFSYCFNRMSYIKGSLGFELENPETENSIRSIKDRIVVSETTNDPLRIVFSMVVIVKFFDTTLVSLVKFIQETDISRVYFTDGDSFLK